MSPIEVAHSLPTGAAVATVAAEGYDLGSAVRAWAISRGLGLHAGSAGYWGSRRWVNDRFFDDHIRRLVEWCEVHVPGAPTWSCERT